MFIGPVEGYANVLTTEGLAVGLLQLYHPGKDFPIYHRFIMPVLSLSTSQALRSAVHSRQLHQKYY